MTSFDEMNVLPAVAAPEKTNAFIADYKRADLRTVPALYLPMPKSPNGKIDEPASAKFPKNGADLLIILHKQG